MDDMDGMDMGPPSFPPDYPRCAPYGNGTYQYGHYLPTDAEVTYCQETNDPWGGQFKYGIYTSYYLAVVTALFIFARVVKHDRGLRSLCAKPLAAARLATYPILSSWLPPLGSSLLILAFACFSGGYTFGNRVYTRPPNFGSWPIGLRPGWIATAMMPWIYELAAKRNFLSVLTAISHEKMQVVHQYGGWILFALSFVHTIGLQIRAMKQAPWSYTWANDSAYWTGYSALGPLAVLCLLSLPQIRRKWYEAFYIIHFLAAAFFAWWMTDHVMRLMGSQYYCYVSIALWSAALIWRHGAVLFGLTRHLMHGRGLPRASAELLPGGLVKLTIRTSMTWKPGHHIFLRVLTCRPAETHPFTIASLPRHSATRAPVDTESSVPADDGLNELVLLIRPEDGFTQRLFSLVKAETTAGRTLDLPVLVDGPYGEAVKFGTFESVLLIAGGAGISFVLPVLRDVIRAAKEIGTCRDVKMVWAARDAAIFEQFRPEIQETLASAPQWTKVDIGTFITDGSAQLATSDGSEADEKSIEKEERTPSMVSTHGRPDVSQQIADAASAVGKGRLAVGACGPETLLIDVRNGVVQCQKDILRGNITAEEVALHSEMFSW